ncbi:MAG TPA: hypothetical protein VFW98_12275 [Gemmatimonadaceae bacterium]|nr:hypothetical protein [Gemmatimonadaceae bacterium]
MPVPALPPYALTRPHFPFPALAAQVGRARLGAGREVALACLMAARLVGGAVPAEQLSPPQRDARARAARGYFASRVLPAAVRAPIEQLVAASTDHAEEQLAGALRSLALAAARYLDAASRRELEQLAKAAQR